MRHLLHTGCATLYGLLSLHVSLGVIAILLQWSPVLLLLSHGCTVITNSLWVFDYLEFTPDVLCFETNLVIWYRDFGRFTFLLGVVTKAFIVTVCTAKLPLGVRM